MMTDAQKFREFANLSREMGDLYSQIADAIDSDNDDESALTEMLGKLILLQLKFEKLS